MNDSHIVSLAQLEEILKAVKVIKFQATKRKDKYSWLDNILNRFRYFRLNKKAKGTVKKYLVKLTGYSDPQLKRLIGKKKRTGKLIISENWGKRNTFTVIYSPSDIAALAETDMAHNRLSGKATKKIFNNMSEKFGDVRFEKLKNISVSHIYNLRATRQYCSRVKIFTKTDPVKIPIGIRKKPNPQGKPGYLRVDSVHQGDLHLGYGQYLKGVYHINLVDEVTQWEIVACVEGISERYLIPLLEEALTQFPFRIINFHSDNGSEYINYKVADILNRLIINQTKSRSRHSNDNGLVEGKNGWVIRKWMGHSHIPRKFADRINNFYKIYFNVYLNFHRPCGYATTFTDKKGRQRKVYKEKNYMMPYEKLKSLNNVSSYLAPGWTIRRLDETAAASSDNEFAQIVQQQKRLLFQSFKH